MCDEHCDCPGDDCASCEAEFVEAALDAGIPRSVIERRTTLRDHFSQQTIDLMCGRDGANNE